MEIKSLKDIEEEERKGYEKVGDEDNYSGWATIERIKQEAIKWLIYGIKKRKNMFKMFMEFHNITEEDLETQGIKNQKGGNSQVNERNNIKSSN